MLGPLDAVVFDFDGTLVALKIDFRAMRDGVTELGITHGLPRELFDGKFILEAAREATAAIAARDGTAAAEAFRAEADRRIEAPEIEAARHCTVIPGAGDCLRTLHDRGIKVGVVTRNSRRSLEPVLDGWAGLIDALLPRDGRELVKPHPSHLLDALELLGCSPERATMVGDHPTDIACGRSVGARTVGVLTGTAKAPDLAEADLVLDSVATLPAHIVFIARPRG